MAVPAAVPPPGKRRQFSEELKQRVVAETHRPGASASDIARRYGLDLRLLRRWRKVYATELNQLAGDQP
jgi:transposase-like protein